MTDYPRLVMNQGPQPGQMFVLDQEMTSLGRDPGNDIVINDPQISRKHSRITRQGASMVLEDVGSTNGTFVNGMRLTSPHTLDSGNVVGLGDAVTLTYHGRGVGIATTEPLAEQPAFSAMPEEYEPDFPPPPPPAYTPAPPPPPPSAASPVEETKSRTRLWIGCGCVAIALACVAVALFLWFAPASFWQALIDFGIPVPTWPF